MPVEEFVVVAQIFISMFAVVGSIVGWTNTVYRQALRRFIPRLERGEAVVQASRYSASTCTGQVLMRRESEYVLVYLSTCQLNGRTMIHKVHSVRRYRSPTALAEDCRWAGERA